LNVRLICVGKLKESFYREAAAEFTKRLSRYCAPEIVEVPDEKAPENASPAQREQIKRAEGARLLAKVAEGDLVVAMDLEGCELSSPQLAARMEGWMNGGRSRLCFLVGGSLGLSPEALDRADLRLCFGKPTFSHQIFRIMLLEQLYRAFKIISGEPYHK